MEGQVHFSDGKMLEGPAYRAGSWLFKHSLSDDIVLLGSGTESCFPPGSS